MPHTDTNISRDALRNYGMQPTRRLDGSRSAKDRGAGPDAGAERENRTGGTIRIYRDTEETDRPVNPAKVYVDVLAEFTREGFLRPCRITWEDGRKYMIDRVKRCERRASRKAGGMGLMYTCMVEGQEVNLLYEENQRWFVTRK